VGLGDGFAEEGEDFFLLAWAPFNS
jgi:hypothetical protein